MNNKARILRKHLIEDVTEILGRIGFKEQIEVRDFIADLTGASASTVTAWLNDRSVPGRIDAVQKLFDFHREYRIEGDAFYRLEVADAGSRFQKVLLYRSRKGAKKPEKPKLAFPERPKPPSLVKQTKPVPVPVPVTVPVPKKPTLQPPTRVYPETLVLGMAVGFLLGVGFSAVISIAYLTYAARYINL